MTKNKSPQSPKPKTHNHLLRVAIQMDPLAGINPKSDSTLLLGLEAQKRGYALYVYTPDKLSMREGKITARGHRVTLHSKASHFYDLGKEETIDLRTMDVVLLRQDPPFDMTYLSTTYILERLMPDVLVVNHPTHVRDNPEKLFPLLFQKYSPPTLISADVAAIEAFRKDHKDIVIKPLYGFGGHSIFRLKKDDQNFNALMETIFATSKEPWVVQPFLPQVKTGERRIIMIDGECAGIFGRIPPEGEIRSNLRIGGTPAKAKLTSVQRDICDAIGPALKQQGLILAGVDVIGDYLTEINITSPTGLAAMNALGNVRLEGQAWDAIEARL